MGHYAVIEIGSNAVRMILGEKEDDSSEKVLLSWSSYFRLGQEVFSKGNISVGGCVMYNFSPFPNLKKQHSVT